MSMREICSHSHSSDLDSSPATFGGPSGSAGPAAAVSNPLSTPSRKAAPAHSPSLDATAPLAILIPAYRPGPVLVELVRELSGSEIQILIVVDDGSGPGYAHLFEEVRKLPRVEVVANAVNLGKGAALKAGINFILCAHPETAGIVTVDADGQHHPADVLKVCRQFQEDKYSLVLGVRDFGGGVPLRSKLGNGLTKHVMKAVLGRKLTDTQTGLRAIPRSLLPVLLRMPAMGYEFELEMLIAAKHLGVAVNEQPIRTIYEPGNPSSHFQPLRDSMRIYFVLLRFTFIAVLTAALDNLVFFSLFRATGYILASQIGGRIVAVLFNYAFVRRAVFLSDQRHKVVLPRYLLLVLTNAALSYLAIRLLVSEVAMPVLAAKILAEGLLFVANFTLQRDFVFTKRIRPR